MKRMRRVQGIRRNRSGGIEGLPLQLLILIVIAALGTSVIVGWMNDIETPKSIGDVTVDNDSLPLGSPDVSGNRMAKERFSVYVTDQDGNPLEGATVVITGLGANDGRGGTVYSTTDANGKAVFGTIYVKLSSPVGHIDINVSKAGYGENRDCRIAVIS
ncbi:MAG: carboxypeptidase regulatory-like domain-containing protein [Thermoplasmatales archaeon]|nr:carboxypeptidase regulatory-like domain-containing protein [Thermoplasmatales archaeon]